LKTHVQKKNRAGFRTNSFDVKEGWKEKKKKGIMKKRGGGEGESAPKPMAKTLFS